MNEFFRNYLIAQSTNTGEPTQSSPQLDAIGTQLTNGLMSPLGGVLVLCAIGYIFAGKSYKRTPDKGVLSSGRLADLSHRKRAMQTALDLIESRKHNEVALYIGTPKGSVIKRIGKKLLLSLKKCLKTIWLVNCESGIICIGGNGSGKTFSFLLPLFRSALQQAFPAQFFDVKYSSHTKRDSSATAQLYAFAQWLGYKVSLFAPGLPESRRCNILTAFVKDYLDVDGAKNLALTINKTFSGDGERVHPFFRDLAISTIQGLILLALMVEEYPDILTVRQLFRHPNLPDIIRSPLVPETVRNLFDPYLDSLEAPEQLAGGKSTIGNILNKISHPALCGETNMPIDLDGRELIIYGVDGGHRQTSIILNLMLLQMITIKNLLRPRTTPLVVELDEVSVGYIMDLDEWPNLYRSAGLVLLLGIQSLEMLIKRYTFEGAKRIVKGCMTHSIFQLVDLQEAETYSKLVGQEDVSYESESSGTSKSRGGGSSSNNRSDHRSTVNLLQPYEITSFPKGKCLIFNRGFEDNDRSRIPVIQQIKIPKEDLDQVSLSVSEWDGIKAKLLEDPCPTHFEDREYSDRNRAISQFFGVLDPSASITNIPQDESQGSQQDDTPQESQPLDVSQIPIEELIAHARTFSNIEDLVPTSHV